MGTSNFLYRDTLYALDTYVPADEAVTDAIHEAIYKYDELRLSVSVDNEDLTEEEVEEIKDKLYAEAVAEVEAFIAEANRIYHELGKKYFESYRVVARVSNGETLYEKTA